MIHRNEYMANSSELHRAYHAQFVNRDILNMVESHIGLEALKKSTDPHMNDIPLRKWDAMAIPMNISGYTCGSIADGAFIRMVSGKLMRECGESGVSLAFAVCVLKEAGKRLAGIA